ncbi:MAG: FdhF/YdeP family oxidoreductase [Pedosphaera sp.]|nr:FdhF/YdeP family oxidoreductase [Pedosphaera sp.]
MTAPAQNHRVQKTWRDYLAKAIPFGIGTDKPKHFRDMLGVVWENRDNLPYAWKVLTRGVCDGCALGVAGLHDWTIDGVHLCMTRLNLLRLNTMPALDVSLLEDISKLEKLDNAQLRELGRLPFPMLRKKGDKGFQRITWDDAIARVAHRIQSSTPKRWAMFVTARGVTNEVYYMAQKAARFLGTNNVDNAARLCHAPSTNAMKHAVGVAASTCSYKDWYGTDLIIFFGANPANDQPVTTKYLHEAKLLGTKIVLVNPYLEPGMKRYWVPSTVTSCLFGTDITDYWFPVTQGGDIAFLHGVLKILIERGWVNREFIEKQTAGFEEFKNQSKTIPLEKLAEQSGLPIAAMEEFAGLIRDAKNAVLVWSMGLTQHNYGADAVSMVLNLGLARGYVGRDKCGLMPIRGHSSVQGGAEMGAYATAFPGSKTVNAENAALLSAQYGFEIPNWPGLTAPEMVESCARGDLDLLYCLGGNFLRTLPEPGYVRRALANVPMRVHQDIILTDQMFIETDEVILLPAKTRYEQDDGGIETTTERRIAFSPEIPRQLGEARAEWKIVRDIAAAARPEHAAKLGCKTGAEVRQEIARIVPFYDGIQNLEKTGDAIQYGGAHLCADGQFPTADGKAHFKTVELPKLDKPKGVFEVSTRRGKQFNTLIYAELDPFNSAPRDAVLMNPDDAAVLHLIHGDRVALVNHLGQLDCRVHLAPIARGNLQVHWPEGNVIIRRDLRDGPSGIPDYNSQVRIERL